jgi:hypothetical protein
MKANPGNSLVISLKVTGQKIINSNRSSKYRNYDGSLTPKNDLCHAPANIQEIDSMKSNTTINPLKDIGTLLVMVILSIVGAIIGVQLITTLGVTPNTSIIGRCSRCYWRAFRCRCSSVIDRYIRKTWRKR